MIAIPGGLRSTGHIALLDREKFYPGDEGVVDFATFDTTIETGSKFFIYEGGAEPLGEGLALEISFRPVFGS